MKQRIYDYSQCGRRAGIKDGSLSFSKGDEARSSQPKDLFDIARLEELLNRK